MHVTGTVAKMKYPLSHSAEYWNGGLPSMLGEGGAKKKRMHGVFLPQCRLAASGAWWLCTPQARSCMNGY